MTLDPPIGPGGLAGPLGGHVRGRTAGQHPVHQRQPGPLLLALGLMVAVVGLSAWNGGLSWFGRLPGDIRIEHENVRLHIPVVSMLIVSAVASILLSPFRR